MKNKLFLLFLLVLCSCNKNSSKEVSSSVSGKISSSTNISSEETYDTALEELNNKFTLDFNFLEYKENCDLSNYIHAIYERGKNASYFSKEYGYPYFEGVELGYRVRNTEFSYYTFGSLNGYEKDVLKFISFSDTSIEFFGLTLNSESHVIYNTFTSYGYQGRVSIDPTGTSYTFKKENITVYYSKKVLNDYGTVIRLPFINIET